MPFAKQPCWLQLPQYVCDPANNHHSPPLQATTTSNLEDTRVYRLHSSLHCCPGSIHKAKEQVEVLHWLGSVVAFPLLPEEHRRLCGHSVGPAPTLLHPLPFQSVTFSLPLRHVSLSSPGFVPASTDLSFSFLQVHHLPSYAFVHVTSPDRTTSYMATPSEFISFL